MIHIASNTHQRDSASPASAAIATTALLHYCTKLAMGGGGKPERAEVEAGEVRAAAGSVLPFTFGEDWKNNFGDGNTWILGPSAVNHEYFVSALNDAIAAASGPGPAHLMRMCWAVAAPPNRWHHSGRVSMCSRSNNSSRRRRIRTGCGHSRTHLHNCVLRSQQGTLCSGVPDTMSSSKV